MVPVTQNSAPPALQRRWENFQPVEEVDVKTPPGNIDALIKWVEAAPKTAFGTHKHEKNGGVITFRSYQDDRGYFTFRVTAPAVGVDYRGANWTKAKNEFYSAAKKLEAKTPGINSIELRGPEADAYKHTEEQCHEVSLPVYKALFSLRRILRACRECGLDIQDLADDILALGRVCKEVGMKPITLIKEATSIMKTIIELGLTIAYLIHYLRIAFPAGCRTKPITEVLDLFIADLPNNRTKDTVNNYRRYIGRLATYLKDKPCWQVTGDDFKEFLKDQTYTRDKKSGTVKVAPSTRKLIRDCCRSFFNWAAREGYYDRLGANPVPREKETRKKAKPTTDILIPPDKLREWIELAPWYFIPYIVCYAILGVRPKTIQYLTWDMFDWDGRRLYVPGVITKFEAHPYLGDLALQLLLPWKGCKGPVIPVLAHIDGARALAKKIGIDLSNNNGRKSSISYYGAILSGSDLSKTDRLNNEFGNSEEVRSIYYNAHVDVEIAQQYFGITPKSQPTVEISDNDLWNLWRSQIDQLVKIFEHMHQKEGHLDRATSEKDLAELQRKWLRQAKETLWQPSLPGFVHLNTSGSELLREHLELKTLTMEAFKMVPGPKTKAKAKRRTKQRTETSQDQQELRLDDQPTKQKPPVYKGQPNLPHTE